MFVKICFDWTGKLNDCYSKSYLELLNLNVGGTYLRLARLVYCFYKKHWCFWSSLYLCKFWKIQLMMSTDCSSQFLKWSYVSKPVFLQPLCHCWKDRVKFLFCYTKSSLLNQVASISVIFYCLINYILDNIYWIFQYCLEVLMLHPANCTETCQNGAL